MAPCPASTFSPRLDAFDGKRAVDGTTLAQAMWIAERFGGAPPGEQREV